MLLARSWLPGALILVVAGAQAQTDARASAIAADVMKALGGAAAWENTRFLRWDFAVEREQKNVMTRSHWWDRYDGRYRLAGKTRDGEDLLVLMNVQTKQGRAWKAGKELEGEELQRQLDGAFGAWTNDMYWLLMPYKLGDPGVMLSHDGQETVGGQIYDKLLLAFDNVGLTPKDKYWVYVNRKTKTVDRWDFILKGGPGPASTFSWTGWKRCGAVMLPSDHVNPKDGTRIHFPVLDAPAAMADAVFTSPEAVR